MELISFPIARYQFQFKVTQPIELPDYAGSTLRGAFGRALHKISCMTKQNDCKICPLYRTCPYTNIFETPAPKNHQIQQFSQVPNGYMIEPPEWGKHIYQIGDLLTFNLVLFGRLVEQLPLIAFAFKRAFEYNIAGGKGELLDIAHFPQDSTIYNSILNDGNIISHNTELLISTTFPPKMTLEFITPLRLQDNGKPLKENNITLQRFLITLAKRISLLSEFHYQPLNLNFELLISQIEQIEETKQLNWLDWTRYSSRQQQKMKLGGLIGKWWLTNIPNDWAKLIYLGQYLHCGKNATFGLGCYQLIE